MCIDKGRDASVKVLVSVINGFQLIDSYRAVNGQDAGFTWANTRGSQSRLDYVFLPKGQKVRGAGVAPVWFTDHAVLTVGVEVSAVVFGRGYWKLNVEVICDQRFKQEFVQVYKGWCNLRPLFDSWVDWWEGVKKRVGILVRRCVKRMWS